LWVLVTRRRSRESWADELTVWAVPVTILFAMSFLTNICLGLRYILPIAPYVFISVGKVVPWAESLSGWRARAAFSFIVLSLGTTTLATLLIHPHYLAYFNTVSGGPDRRPARLIDSNIDWGQDLVGLSDWLREHAPGQRVGLAYFGQINPSIFALRGEAFDWFIPPPRPGTMRLMPEVRGSRLFGPASRLRPGLYAVSATLVYGLPWRLYDSAPPNLVPEAWAPVWHAFRPGAFSYFQGLTPVDRIGHSIYIYRVRPEDVERLEALRNASTGVAG
jgi:hypothetical protein